MAKCPIPLKDCRSSQLRQIGYDPATKKLAIRFHGKSGEKIVYVYDNVPQAHFDGLMSAHADEKLSVGKYFGQHIKGQKDKHPFTKLVEGE